MDCGNLSNSLQSAMNIWSSSVFQECLSNDQRRERGSMVMAYGVTGSDTSNQSRGGCADQWRQGGIQHHDVRSVINNTQQNVAFAVKNKVIDGTFPHFSVWTNDIVQTEFGSDADSTARKDGTDIWRRNMASPTKSSASAWSNISTSAGISSSVPGLYHPKDMSLVGTQSEVAFNRQSPSLQLDALVSQLSVGTKVRAPSYPPSVSHVSGWPPVHELYDQASSVDNGTDLWRKPLVIAAAESCPKQATDDAFSTRAIPGYQPCSLAANLPLAHKNMFNSTQSPGALNHKSRHVPQTRSQLIQILMDLGFQREDAQAAIIKSNMNFELALVELLSKSNLPASAIGGQRYSAVRAQASNRIDDQVRPGLNETANRHGNTSGTVQQQQQILTELFSHVLTSMGNSSSTQSSPGCSRPIVGASRLITSNLANTVGSQMSIHRPNSVATNSPVSPIYGYKKWPSNRANGARVQVVSSANGVTFGINSSPQSAPEMGGFSSSVPSGVNSSITSALTASLGLPGSCESIWSSGSKSVQTVSQCALQFANHTQNTNLLCTSVAVQSQQLSGITADTVSSVPKVSCSSQVDLSHLQDVLNQLQSVAKWQAQFGDSGQLRSLCSTIEHLQEQVEQQKHQQSVLVSLGTGGTGATAITAASRTTLPVCPVVDCSETTTNNLVSSGEYSSGIIDSSHKKKVGQCIPTGYCATSPEKYGPAKDTCKEPSKEDVKVLSIKEFVPGQLWATSNVAAAGTIAVDSYGVTNGSDTSFHATVDDGVELSCMSNYDWLIETVDSTSNEAVTDGVNCGLDVGVVSGDGDFQVDGEFMNSVSLMPSAFCQPVAIPCSLILKNVSKKIDSAMLKTLCANHGQLDSFTHYPERQEAVVAYTDHYAAVSAQRSLNECLIGDQYLVADFVYDDSSVTSGNVDVFDGDSATSWTGGFYQCGWSLGDENRLAEQMIPDNDQLQL